MRARLLLCWLLLASVVGAGAHARADATDGDVMHCACGASVARGSDLVAVSAPGAERVFTDVPLVESVWSIRPSRGTSNATVSRLRNPHGYVFDVVTLSQTFPRGAAIARGPPTERHTFFPGYGWQPIQCASCGAHLGWRFLEAPGALAAISRARRRVHPGAPRDGDEFVGLALEKLRFARGKLTFRWSPDDGAFVSERRRDANRTETRVDPNPAAAKHAHTHEPDEL